MTFDVQHFGYIRIYRVSRGNILVGASMTAILADQKNGEIKVSTPLGENVLTLTRASCKECLSKPFEYVLHMLSAKTDIKASDLVGKSIDFAILDGSTWRSFNGYVMSFEGMTAPTEGISAYNMVVAPWIHFLHNSVRCRVFQNENVIDIVKKIADEFGFASKLEVKANKSYKPYIFKVQYEESDFDFIHRLLAEEGIFYYFLHEKGDHKLVLADEKSIYGRGPYESIQYKKGTTSVAKAKSLSIEESFRPGKAIVSSYNPEDPESNLAIDKPAKPETPAISQGISEDQFSVHSDTQSYHSRSDGEQIAELIVLRERCGSRKVTFETNVKGMLPGNWFSIDPQDDFPSDFEDLVIIRQIWYFKSQAFKGGFGRYSSTIEAIPKSVTFAPPIGKPKPLINSIQRATVVGEKGKEINTGEGGMVLAQFHWDREGKNDENSSCWIRVMQSMAGSQYGIFAWPRIGNEVLVAFVNGNPDQPIIVGSLYNGKNNLPYPTPDNEHIIGMKSQTIEGGDEDYNEITLHDKKDEELINIQAQKDYRELVKNDKNVKIENDSNFEVVANVTEKIGENFTTEVGGDVAYQTDGSLTTNVKGDELHTVKGAQKVDVTDGITVDSKGGISIKAATKITLNCGGSTVEIGPDGIKINGMQVGVKAPQISLG